MLNKNIIYSTVILMVILSRGFSLLYANGDDDHSKDNPDNVKTNQEPYAEGYTGKFEIVVTLGNVKPNVASTQTIYLSDYNTNAPVENAKIHPEITGVDNSKITTPVQVEPGVYEFSVEFPEIKKYDFLFNIISGDINDLIAINEVDLAHDEQTDIAEDNSFIAKELENWLWIISSIVLISIIAFISYWMGKRSNSKINLAQEYNSTKI